MNKVLTLVLLVCCVLSVDARRKTDYECEKEQESIMADALLPLEQASNDVFEPNNEAVWRYGYMHCNIHTINNEQGKPDHVEFLLEEKEKNTNHIYKVKLVDGKAVVLNHPGFTAM